MRVDNRSHGMGALAVLVLSCALVQHVLAAESAGLGAAVSQAPSPVKIYTAPKVITMERENPFATAVAVAGGKILAAGTLEEVKSTLGDRPYSVDDTLSSKIIMPGFIDQHLHPVLGALTLAAEVIAPKGCRPYGLRR